MFNKNERETYMLSSPAPFSYKFISIYLYLFIATIFSILKGAALTRSYLASGIPIPYLPDGPIFC